MWGARNTYTRAIVVATNAATKETVNFEVSVVVGVMGRLNKRSYHL
jgi:hypothetical protein